MRNPNDPNDHTEPIADEWPPRELEDEAITWYRENAWRVQPDFMFVDAQTNQPRVITNLEMHYYNLAHPLLGQPEVCDGQLPIEGTGRGGS